MQTRWDSFPMPLVHDVISQLRNQPGLLHWICCLVSGRFKCLLNIWKRWYKLLKLGCIDWTIMPFGLKNVNKIFTRTVSKVFKELGDKFLKIFVDDLNIHNKNWEEHLQHLDVIFFKLKKVNLKLNFNKCCFVAKKSCFWVMWLEMKALNQILVKLMQYCIF